MQNATLLLLLLLTILYAPIDLYSQYQISGNIEDENGEPLVGATVQIMESNKGTISGGGGAYMLANIKSGSYFLEVSYLGYGKRQMAIEVSDVDVIQNIEMAQVPDQLNEIVVSASRRLEDIQKTSSTVSAVESKQIEQLQIKNFNELNSIAPNFRSYDDGGTGAFTLFASRGIATIDLNPVVGLYIDDIPYFTTFAFPLSLSDVDQIEILRGLKVLYLDGMRWQV